MTQLPVFLGIGGVMVLVTCALLIVPLMRQREQNAPLAAGVVIAIVPLATLGLYLVFSNWSWQEQPLATASPEGSPSVAEMVSNLENRLRSEPQDLQGWLMLGRSYVVLGRYPDAVAAYGRARELSADNVDALTGYAEALALVAEGAIGEESAALFERAIALAPDDRKALWYGGLAAFDRGDKAVARQRWQRLLEFDPPESMAQLLREQIALTEVLSPDAPTAVTPDDQTSATSGVRVAVRLDQALSARVPRDAPVFILARPVNGGGPPLAVVRRQVADLPLDVVLSDADSMVPGRKISDHERVEVVARVALGGTPAAQPGDFYGKLVAGRDSSISIAIDKVH